MVFSDDADGIGHSVESKYFMISGEKDRARAEYIGEVDGDGLSIVAVLDALEDLVSTLFLYFGVAEDTIYNPKSRRDGVGHVVKDGAQQHARNISCGDVICNAVFCKRPDIGRALLVAARVVVLREAVEEFLAAFDSSCEEEVLWEDVQYNVHKCWVVIAKTKSRASVSHRSISWARLTRRPSVLGVNATHCQALRFSASRMGFDGPYTASVVARMICLPNHSYMLIIRGPDGALSSNFRRASSKTSNVFAFNASKSGPLLMVGWVTFTMPLIKPF